jgi:hypothetical protein
MPGHFVNRRAPFFLAVEGASEQAFVAWLQALSEKRLRIHLDVFRLGGGGFKSMLQKAVRFHTRNCDNVRYRERFLIVDRDRATQGDWALTN